jgi:hypothetical protein
MSATKKAKHIKSTEEQWRDIFSEWSTSGLSEGKFCKRENYSTEAFRYMWKELKMPSRKKPSTQAQRTKVQTRSDAVPLVEAVQQSTNPFVPLHLVSSEPQQEQLKLPHTKVDETQQTISILVPGGAVLRMTDNCNLNFVAELYSLLKT